MAPAPILTHFDLSAVKQTVPTITKSPSTSMARPSALAIPRGTPYFVDRNSEPYMDERPGEGGAADHGRTSESGQDPEETTAFRYPDAHG
jgi:hypothetical protein